MVKRGERWICSASEVGDDGDGDDDDDDYDDCRTHTHSG